MTHGSRELDEDAAKLIALGQDPGPELEDFEPSEIERLAEIVVEVVERRCMHEGWAEDVVRAILTAMRDIDIRGAEDIWQPIIDHLLSEPPRAP
jgi:hypothetical protein